MRWPGYVAGLNKIRNAFKIVLGKPDKKKLLRRPRLRWKDNIKMILGK
jgi:hypothetical protein